MSCDNPSSNRPEGQRQTQQAVRIRQDISVHSSPDIQDSSLIPAPLHLPTINNPEAKLPTRTLNSPTSISSWRHTNELQYIYDGWEDIDIVRFLVTNAVSIPASTPNPLFHVVSSDNSKVLLPAAYRLAILWVSKFQWRSLKMALTILEDKREIKWETAKFELLHIARLCETLLTAARTATSGTGVDDAWRCAPFDRVLHRYHRNCFIQRDEFVRDFWLKFGGNVYEEDVLKLAWDRWVLRENARVSLTLEEVTNGISAAEFMEGLIVDANMGSVEWSENHPKPVAMNFEALMASTTIMTTSVPISGAPALRGPGENMLAAPTDDSHPVSNKDVNRGYTSSLTHPLGHLIVDDERRGMQTDELGVSKQAESLMNALVRYAPGKSIPPRARKFPPWHDEETEKDPFKL